MATTKGKRASKESTESPSQSGRMGSDGTMGEDQTLNALRAALAERQQQAGRIEAEEQVRARTPLAVVLQRVSCRWASEQMDDQHTLPVGYLWPTRRCHLGKTAPDQDCRDCLHHVIKTVGSERPHYERRYHDHGYIMPLAGEADAEALAGWLRDRHGYPLRRVQQEIDAISTAITRLVAQAEADRRAEQETQQRGGRRPS